ncbi:MAG: cupin domain-containing protein [Betaproteobacteria bacterium]
MRIAASLLVALAVAAAPAAHSADGARMVLPEQLKWADAPSVGAGVKIAVIEGPLNQAVPFTFRLKMPANTRIAPHVHPAYERVTVLSGTFHFAHGESFDAAKSTALGIGGVAIMPPGAPMFGYTREETVIQLHGTGPWGIRYLDPADDPRRN